MTLWPVSDRKRPFMVYVPGLNLEDVLNVIAELPLDEDPPWFLSISGELTPFIEMTKKPDSLLEDSEDMDIQAIM